MGVSFEKFPVVFENIGLVSENLCKKKQTAGTTRSAVEGEWVIDSLCM